jgi:gas vesicle protein
MSTGKVFLGVLAGVATGALLGVLFAPNKGSKTRKKIARKGEDYTELIQEKFNEFVETVTEKFEHVKDEVSGFAHQAQAKAEAVKKDLKTA